MSYLALLLLAITVLGPAHGESPNDTLHVSVSGAGDPVVLIPGLLGSAFGFRKVVERLEEAGHRTIVVEPLGFGRSNRPNDADYSLTAQADRIAQVLDTLVGDEPVRVIAHSVGASIAYRLAYRHPGRVRSILSIEGGVTETLMTPGMRVALKFAPAFRMLGPGAAVQLIRRQMGRASAASDWITRDVIMAYTEGFRRDYGETLRAMRAMAEAREPDRLADHLGEIACPVVLLVGAAEHVSGPDDDDIDLLGRSLADFRVVAVPEAGHFIHEEQSGAVVDAFRQTLAAVGGPDGADPVDANRPGVRRG